jgi:hypothetical protein
MSVMGISFLGRIALAIGRARGRGEDLHDQAKAALSVIQAWQPIESAPKGTGVGYVDLWVVDKISGKEWRLPDAFWDDTRGIWVWRSRRIDGVKWKATHWMPLPKPPQAM